MSLVREIVVLCCAGSLALMASWKARMDSACPAKETVGAVVLVEDAEDADLKRPGVGIELGFAGVGMPVTRGFPGVVAIRESASKAELTSSVTVLCTLQ
jgi:hypothetical protein